jgi:serine/threonine-protein kinase RsbW/sigma-B regulation protein RsbU (phosphoserine phosphatase)
MAEPDDLRLEVSSDPQLLGLIRGVLQTWLEILHLFPDRRSDIVLAVDEACSNAIRHAYRGRPDGRVELVLSRTDDWIEITVSDQGTPCPAECAEYRPLTRPVTADVTPGGLGVKLIYEVFDEVRFCPGTTRGNCVTMRLRRGGAAR